MSGCYRLATQIQGFAASSKLQTA